MNFTFHFLVLLQLKKRDEMKRYIPKYITDKSNIIQFLLFVSFYAIIFIFVYRPFGSERWISIDQNVDRFVFYAILVVLMGFATLTVSRLIMYFVSRKHEISVASYILWIFMEVAAIAFAVTLFAWLVSRKLADRAYFNIYPRSFLITALILFIPYIITYMYFTLKNKEKELDELAKALQCVQNNPVAPAGSGTGRETPGMLQFRDEKGELKLSILSDALLYLESADNYVRIHYLNGGKISHYILRNTLKNIEMSFPQNLLLRCHRSYIVHTKKIRMLSKTKEGLFIELDADGLPAIPVSKTYAEHCLRVFSEG